MPRGGSSSSSGEGAPPRLFLSLRPLLPLIGWRPLLATPPCPPAAVVREYQRVMAALAPPPEVTQVEEERQQEGAGLSRDLLELLWDPEVPRQAAALISPRFLADILEEDEEEGREASATPKMAAPAARSDLPKMAAPATTSARRGRLDLPKMAARFDLPKMATPPDLPKMAAPIPMTTTPAPSQDGGSLSPPKMAAP